MIRRIANPGVTAAGADARERMQGAGGLMIGGVRDPAETAADRLAERVMRMPEPVGVIRRECAECAAEDRARRQVVADEEEEPVRMRAAAARIARGAASAPAPAAAKAAIGALGTGRPLLRSERSFFAPRFGADLSAVRVHDDAAAARAARALDARAFTLGNDIAFAPGERSPGTSAGDRLMAHELAHFIQQGSGGAASDVSAARPGLKTNAGSILARTPSPQRQPSFQVTQLARQAINELDDGRDRRLLLQTFLSAFKLSELPAYAAILRAAPHKTYGDHFVFLIAKLEQSWGSKATISVLLRFADAGVDISKLNYSLDPLAAVARFKSLVQRYQAALSSGRVREADRQRVDQAIAEAEVALRRIEGPGRKPGAQVSQMGGVAAAAGVAWSAAAALAADDVTVIGVADDVVIPFVVIAAAALSAIAIFTGGRKPEILDYGPAKAKVDAALAAIAAAVDVAAHVPRPAPLPAAPRAPTREPQRPPPRPEPAPVPQTGPTVDIAPQPDQPEKTRRARRACPEKVSLPSGRLPEAEMAKSDRGYTLQVPFSMSIDFKNDPERGCDCSRGEYLQQIRGWAKADLGKGWKDHPMPPTATGQQIDLRNFQEDGPSPYGHRYIGMGIKRRGLFTQDPNDQFLPDPRATGCQYRGKDRAGFDLENPPPGARYRFRLFFRGVPVDALGRVPLQDWQTWECYGEMEIPEPSKPTRTRRSPPARQR